MNNDIKILVDLAISQVGVKEGAVNNTGERVEEYQVATWLAPGAWPWCAAFTSWLMREWLEHESVWRAIGFTSFSQADKWRCRDASAFGWEKWAKQKNIKILGENNLAKAGDFVVFDFSHIGLVVEDQKSPDQKIVTVEGNTNGKGERDSVSGDGVWKKTRDPKLTKSYLRIFV